MGRYSESVASFRARCDALESKSRPDGTGLLTSASSRLAHIVTVSMQRRNCHGR